MKLSWLQRLALFSRRRYKVVFVASALLVVASLVLTLRLKFDTEVLNLLPRNEPAVRAYIEALETFGSNELTLVAIHLPEDAVVEPYQAFADALAARLAELPELKRVEHRIGDPEELLTTFFPKAVLFLDAAGRQALASRLSDEGIRHRVEELRRRLQTLQGISAKQLAKLDPLGLAELFLSRVQSQRGTLQVDWTSGYYLSRDHRMLLILAEPVLPPQNVQFNQRLANGVDGAVAETLARWDEIAGDDAPPAPRVGVGGPHITAVSVTKLIRYDMVLNILTSAPSVFLLFLVTFRRPGTLLYAFAPLVSGLLLTFGFAKLTVGSVSAATSIVAALLIGMGIDFVIVSYGRYIEERRAGRSLEDSLLTMSGSCGRAVWSGAITTTATFYAFAPTDFIGLRQMGFLTGTGILFCALAVFVLLPAMLAWSEDRHEKRGKVPNLYLHSFGSETVTRFCMRHRRPVLWAGAALTVAALALASQAKFDESMKTMRPRGNRGIDVATEVGQTFGSGFDSMTLLLSGRTAEEVIELSEKASAGAQELVDQGILYGYSGVTSLIPSLARQREVLSWLDEERGGALDLARIRGTFVVAAREQGLRTEPFEEGFALLERAVSLNAPIGLADLKASRQTELLLNRFLRQRDGGYKAAVYLFPPANRWRREPPPQALALAERWGPQVALTGNNVINMTVRREVLEDAWAAGIIGFVLVAILLWIDFRSLRRALMALAPLLVGLAWMMGSMVLLDIPMNFVNIFVTTMIIGLGVDYGVHVLHRYLEVRDLPDAEFVNGLHETGKAVSAAAVSTVIGFGSIMFSHYPGLVSTGKVAILGTLSTSLVAITIVPALLAWRREHRLKEIAAQGRVEDEVWDF
jgi:predicted RND superfamily exporter protein